MDAILINVRDPSWWFTGVFFGLVTLVLPWVFRKTQGWLRSISRSHRAKRLKLVKNIRRHPLKISYEISKASANYILFVLVTFGYLFMLLYTPMQEFSKVSKVLMLFVASPIFAFEIMWLRADSFVKEILKYNTKISKRSPDEA